METLCRLILLCLLSCLPGCVSLSAKQLSFDDAVNQRGVISMPYRIQEYGLILIEGIGIDGQSMTFALDTGATRSAIFESALRKVDIPALGGDDVLIHGMVQSERRNVVSAPTLTFANRTFKNVPLVVLEDRDGPATSMTYYDGLLGMDILSHYKLFFSAEAGELKFIPEKIDLTVPPHWDRIELIEAPFADQKRALHTIQIRMAGNLTSALLDTGAEFSVMNWNVVKDSQLRRLKKRLQRDWELQGAVGKFQPITKVRIGHFRGGQKFWQNKDFIVMDINNLDILGMPESPFAIAGMNLFKDETFLIDFQANYIVMRPTGDQVILTNPFIMSYDAERL